MGLDHLVFIPSVLLFGLVVGYVLGQKAALSQMERKRRQLKR